MKKIGIALVVAGLVISIFTGISFRKEESLLEIGDYEITREKEKEVNWPQWAGIVVVVAGMALVLFGKKK
jgi:hypothetical protein